MTIDDPEVYDSRGIGARYQRIWEVRPPSRPRYVRDVFPIPVAGGVHLLGGGEALTLGGDSADWVLRELAPLLDGTRNFDDICDEFPNITTDSLRDVLQLMHVNGLLEEAGDESEQWYADAPVRAQMEFFSRYLRTTGSCRSRDDAQRGLQRGRVRIVGSSAWGALLAEQLHACGVGTIDVAPRDAVGEELVDDDTAPHPHPDVDIVVCLGDRREHLAVARWCVARRMVMLSIEPRSLRLGPLTHPGESACPACAHAQLTDMSDPAPSDHEPIQRMWTTALISRATQQVIAHLSGLFQPALLGRVEAWDPRTGTTNREVLRLPACPLCGSNVTPLTVTLGDGTKDNLALMFHRNVAIRPWHVHQPAGMQHHLSAGVQRLTRSAYLTHSWAVRTPLPAPTTTPAHGLGIAALSFLLHYTFGGTTIATDDGGRHLMRHTASGGNLGSAEAYVVVSDVPGLAAGLYHYVVADHAVERLGAYVGVDALPPSAATIVVVSAVQRLRAKYAERGYVYCLLDAGLVAHRLRELSAKIGQPVTISWEFDDDPVSDALGIDGLSLAPTLCVGVWATADVAEDRATDERDTAARRSKVDAMMESVPWPVGLAARMIAATARPGPSHPSIETSTEPALPGVLEQSVNVTARESWRDGRNLVDVIARRRSGGIRTGTVALDAFGALLAAASSERDAVPCGSLRPALLPVVFDVEGLPPAAYRYDAEHKALLPIRSVSREQVRDDVLLQWEHGQAAAIIFIATPLAQWLNRFGDRGYRGAAVQAGYVADRLYIEAEGHGLTYTASGGFSPTSADELLGLDGYRLTAIFSFVVGASRDSPS